MSRTLCVLVTAVVLAGCTVFGIRSGTEQLPYEVVERLTDGIEVRRYGSRLAAEAAIDADGDEEGRDAAFRLLFAYITGANRAEAEIAMMAPVATEAGGGEEIAMTAPVETVADAGDGPYRMRFYLPAGYDPSSAPAPTDPRVRLVEVPAETLAVVRFSGSWSETAFAAAERRLMAALDDADWTADGKPVAFRYDPPWTLSFLRRNEIAVALAER